MIEQHIDRTLYEELIKAPDDLKEPLRVAYKTVSSERSEQQAALLKEHPYIQNISSGSLYLYSRKRASRADDIVAIADQREQDAIHSVRQPPELPPCLLATRRLPTLVPIRPSSQQPAPPLCPYTAYGTQT